MKKKQLRTAIVAFVLVAVGGVTLAGVAGREDAGVASATETVTTTTDAAPTATTSTIPAEDVDAFLVAWSDSEKAAAFAAFELERVRLEEEAAAAAEAERLAQEQAEYEATVASGGRYVYTEGPNVGGTCVIPSYICQRESGGNYGAVNGSSGAGGMYQFMPSTWNAIASAIAPEWIGVPPQNAPPAVQDQFAAYLWNGGAGCGHWSAC